MFKPGLTPSQEEEEKKKKLSSQATLAHERMKGSQSPCLKPQLATQLANLTALRLDGGSTSIETSV
jgi:hypothetical protein